MENWEKILRKDIKTWTKKASNVLKLKLPKITISLIENSSTMGMYVFGEAFPSEHRIWIEIVTTFATDKAIIKLICHELVHLKYPELFHTAKFNKIVNDCYKTIK